MRRWDRTSSSAIRAIIADRAARRYSCALRLRRRTRSLTGSWGVPGETSDLARGRGCAAVRPAASAGGKANTRVTLDNIEIGRPAARSIRATSSLPRGRARTRKGDRVSRPRWAGREARIDAFVQGRPSPVTSGHTRRTGFRPWAPTTRRSARPRTARAIARRSSASRLSERLRMRFRRGGARLAPSVPLTRSGETRKGRECRTREGRPRP